MIVVTPLRQPVKVEGTPLRSRATPLVVTPDQLALINHVESNAPHPAYDDLPSLTLLFENGLV